MRRLASSFLLGILFLSVNGMMSMNEIQAQDATRVYIGTYDRNPKDKGIYAADLDLGAGTLSEPKRATEIGNPGFLALTPDCQYLYAACGEKKDSVAAFRVDLSVHAGEKELTNLGTLGDLGRSTCHLTIDDTETNLLTAQYGASRFTLLEVDAQSHALLRVAQTQPLEGTGPVAGRQECSHPHSVNFGKDSNLFYVPDLGTDKIMIYRLDAEKHQFAPNDPPFVSVPAGSGPRHMCFHPYLPTAYVVNELANTVIAFHVQKNGNLEAFQTISTLPEDFQGSSTTAEVRATQNGQFLYASNRGHDSIACYHIQSDGSLELRQIAPVHGKSPRHFGLESSSRFLIAANQDSDNVALFAIQPDGKLEFRQEWKLPASPVCVVFSDCTPVWGEGESVHEAAENTESAESWEDENFAWSSLTNKAQTLPEEIFMQELVLARMNATKLDHLRFLIRACHIVLKRDFEPGNREIVQNIAGAAITQLASNIFDNFQNIDLKSAKAIYPLALELKEDLRAAITWNPELAEPHLLYAQALYYSAVYDEIAAIEKSGKIPDMDDLSSFHTPEMVTELTRGIDLARKNPEEVDLDVLTTSLLFHSFWTSKDDVQQALKNLDWLISLNPASALSVRKLRLSMLLDAGKYNELLTEIDSQIKDMEQDESMKRECSSLRKLRVILLYEMKKYPEALNETENLLKENPEDEELSLKKLQIYLTTKDWKNSETFLGTLIKKNAVDSKYPIMRGKLRLSMDKPEEALSDFEQVLDLEPDNMEALQLKIQTLLQLERDSEALDFVRKLASDEPKNFEYRFAVCTLLLSEEQYDNLIGEMDRLRADFHIDDLSKPDFDLEAEENAELVQRGSIFLNFVAGFYLNAGKHAEARKVFETLIKLSPENPLALNNFAWLLATSPDDPIRDGKWALELAKKACELQRIPCYLSTLAAAYAETGDFETAVKIEDEALQLAKEAQDTDMEKSLNDEKASFLQKKPIRVRDEIYKID